MLLTRTVAVLLPFALVACTATARSSDGPRAVTTVYPLTWLVSQIAPDADVTAVTASGQDAHDAELTPQQRAAVQAADVVVHVGDIGFQPQVEQALADAEGAVVAATDVVGPGALLPITSHEADDEHADDEHADDGAADDEHADAEAVDPHVWFDPTLMADIAVAVADSFAEADPDNAEAYRRSGEETATALRTLQDEVAGLLNECAHDTVVVGHEAFGYLLEPHGLSQMGISAAGAHSEATPQRVAQLVAFVREEGLPAVLSEAVEGRADAEVVAREAGVDLVEVASLDVVTDEQAAQGYPALLRSQAEAVATAAECRP